MDTTVKDPLIGQVLDQRYRVLARLARGGMATVYRALDTRLERVVALKVMHPELAGDAEFVARFIREAKSAARLSHPNVVAVFDQGADAGHVFLAMEHIEGRTLRQVLRERIRLSPAEALDLLAPVLAALDAAHEAGIVHRDIKPENVLIADDGRVKVADFGLAGTVASVTGPNATGMLLGSVSYLAPEQAERGVADPRSDVYACGILLYELLTGVKPHRGGNPLEIVAKHLREDVPPPSDLVEGLPPELDALVGRATARNPDERPATAGRLLAQLRRARATLPGGDEQTAPLSVGIVAPAQYEATMVVPMESAAPPLYADRVRAGRTRRPSRGVFAAVVIALAAVGVMAGAWWLGAGRFTGTPSLLSLSYADAAAKASGVGLHVRRGADAFSDTVPVGLVVDTTPQPGHRIVKGGTITLALSAGPERHTVPSLAGVTLDAARQTLASDHLAVGPITRQYSDTADADTVISTDPAPGASLPPDSRVALVVSRGPAPLRLPNVVGLPDGAAMRELRSLGLLPDDTLRDFSATVPAGSVISSNPPPNSPVGRGSAVALTISQGPQLFPVPDVSGQNADAATAVLQAQGFKVTVTKVPLGPGTVRSETPTGGSMRPRGSEIHLFVF